MSSKPGFLTGDRNSLPETEDVLYLLRLGLRRMLDVARDRGQARAVLDLEAARLLSHSHLTPQDYTRLPLICRSCASLNWADAQLASREPA